MILLRCCKKHWVITMVTLLQLYISIFSLTSSLAFLLSTPPINLQQQSVATKSRCYSLILLSAKKKVKKKKNVLGSSSGKGFGGGGQKKSLSQPSNIVAKGDTHQQVDRALLNTSTIHANLISWLKQHPTTYISSKFSIQPSTLGGYGGFVTNSPLLKDEMILRIPRNECCVTYNDALNDVKCGESFHKLIYDQRISSWGMILIAGWIAKEYMIDCEYSDDVASSSIQEEIRGSNNNINIKNRNRRKHTPYLQSLPWYQGGKLQQEHILFWTDDEIETLLKGSKAYNDTMLIRRTVDNAIELLRDVIVPIVDQVRVDIHDGNTLDNKVDYEEAMKGAFVIALSRSFAEEVELDDGTIEIENVLLPLIDILQHSNTPNTYLESYDDYIQVHAAREIDVGEELFHQYQPEDDNVIPPYKFFTRYGFIPGIREPIRDLLKSKSSLFFD